MLRPASFLALTLAAASAHAVPTFIVHQGRLLDGNDQPVSGDKTLSFVLYEKEAHLGSESDPVAWTGTYKVTFGMGGTFSVRLGDKGPNGEDQPLSSDIFAGTTPRWLAVKIDSSEMTPRLRVGAAPYALVSDVAHAVDGGPVKAKLLQIGQIPVVSETGEWVGPTGQLDKRFVQPAQLGQSGGPSLAWANLVGVPAGLADGDNDTTYTAGDGVKLDGTTFAVDATVSRAGHNHDGVYLKPADAAATYLAKSDATATYLAKTDAQSAYARLDGSTTPAGGLANLVVEKGTALPACDATHNVGRLFFNTATSLLQSCDAAGWATLNRDWQRVSYEDFDVASPTGWTGVTGISSCATSTMLGGYGLAGSGAQAARTYDLTAYPHNEVMFRATLWAIDSWDGEEFWVKLGGTKVYSRNIAGNGPMNLCGYSGYTEHVYKIEGSLRNNASSIQMLIGSGLDEAATNESWGIDDLEIFVR